MRQFEKNAFSNELNSILCMRKSYMRINVAMESYFYYSHKGIKGRFFSMAFKLFCGVIGFISGFFFTRLIKVEEPFSLSELLIGFILNPIQFFAAMLCFLVSFVTNAILLKEAIIQTLAILKKQSYSLKSAALGYSVSLSFLLLFQIGFWHTLVLSFFTIIYGIISIDFKKNVVYEHEG